MSIHQPRRQNTTREEVLAYDVLRGNDGRVKLIDMSEGDIRTILLNRCGIEAMNDEYWKQEGMRHLAEITDKMAA